MKNYIMGTAGHVDHGKTALVKALTNTDCDTHPEEKKRGITINLGFANLELAKDIKIGIVDVPGHKDFINTMVAGASGIDFVLLVIAANSGIMPQTIEHLKIMEFLGINKGLVVITKIDLVERDIVDMMRMEVKKFISNTFLKTAEIVDVSSINNFGIPNLKKSITGILKQINRDKSYSNFRMFIDRAFTIKGHGSVVTGSSLGGELSHGDTVWILPQAKEIRVRRIEQYGKEIKDISGVSRLSLNLVGLSISNLKRGSLVSKNYLKPTQMIDAKISLFQKNKSFGIWSSAIFLLGTFQNLVRIHLIDRDTWRSGETAIVQIHLSEPGMVIRGDKFIIRETSGEITLGGGVVIDAYPLHHKRRPRRIIETLTKISEGGVIEFIENEINKFDLFVSLDHLSHILNLKKDKILNDINSQLVKNIIVLGQPDYLYLLNKNRYEKIESKIIQSVKGFHRKYSLVNEGMNFESIVEKLSLERKLEIEDILRHILNNLEFSGKLKVVNNTWALSEHKVILSQKERENLQYIEDYFLNSKLHVPVQAELNDLRIKLHVSEGKFIQLLNLLTSKRRLYFFEGNYIHSDIVEEQKIKLLRHLLKNRIGITVATFRDLIGGNRKICIFLMNIYDCEGLTLREGDLRKITNKGEEFIKSHE